LFGPEAGDLIIDGWHRIARAVHEGLKELPAHFLTTEDERRCRDFDNADTTVPHLPWKASRA
jgi:hypothetical protein